jgi:hypothetical protein
MLEARLEVGEKPVPSDWIRSKAEEENKRNAEALAQQEKQKRDTELIRSLGPQLMKDLRKVLDDDIVAWNQNFPDRQINGTSPIQNGFSVVKIGFPRGVAEIFFNPETLRIQISLERSAMAELQDMYKTDGYVYLRANPDGRDIHMEDRMRGGHLHSSGFSRMILESIAEPNSTHML